MAGIGVRASLPSSGPGVSATQLSMARLQERWLPRALTMSPPPGEPAQMTALLAGLGYDLAAMDLGSTDAADAAGFGQFRRFGLIDRYPDFFRK